jgi:hypothetical protein
MIAFIRLHLIVVISLASIVGCSRSQTDQPKKAGADTAGAQREPGAEKIELAEPNVTTPNARTEADAALKVALAHLTPQGDLMPEGVEVSIECFDAQGRYLRHKEADAYLDPIVSEQDSVDARFKAIKGLADPHGLSFESYNFPGYYLRNKNGRLTVTKCPDEADRKDATFLIVMGLDSDLDGWVSLELLTQPSHFVRNKNGEVWAEEKKDDKGYLESATFRLVKPVPPRG